MRGSRETQIAVVLVLVGVVLAGVALTTDVADWVIVALFIVAAVVTTVAWPGRRSARCRSGYRETPGVEGANPA